MKCGGFKFYTCSYLVLLQWCTCMVLLSVFVLIRNLCKLDPFLIPLRGMALGFQYDTSLTGSGVHASLQPYPSPTESEIS